MKKPLLLALTTLLGFSASYAQTTCRIDTMYGYRFIDGSTTKTPTDRTIYDPSPGDPASTLRTNVYQTYENGVYRNKSRSEYSFNSSGLVSELALFNWDTLNNVWIRDKKYIYTYDADGRMTEYIFQLPNQNGVFQNYSKISRTYNSKGRMTEEQRFNTTVNGFWINSTRKTNTYQSDTIAKNELNEKWDTIASQWVNVNKIERTFDANDRVINLEVYTWNSSNSTWRGDQKVVTVYNSTGVESEENFIWDNSAYSFVKSTINLYTRNIAGYQTRLEERSWNTSSMQYVTNKIVTFSYNANNALTLSKTSLINPSGAVISSSRITNTLDASDRVLVEFTEDSTGTGGGVWRPVNRTTYSYDANGYGIYTLNERRVAPTDTFLTNNTKREVVYNNNGLLISISNYGWVNNAWQPISFDMREYNTNDCLNAVEYSSSWNSTGGYFNSHTRFEYRISNLSTGIVNEEESLISVYPNPVAQGSVLNVNLPQASNYLMTDYAGRVVKVGVLDAGLNSIHTNELSKGFYLLKLNNSTHKIILQ